MIAGHEAVAMNAVIGIPDERMGEVAKAFVVLKPGASLDEAGLIAWCREKMANFKVPRQVQFVPTLPLNASGKVMKPELRKLG
jgi:acyl-coenzyme A synthetase/AMP-(fatty) acid ligase